MARALGRPVCWLPRGLCHQVLIVLSSRSVDITTTANQARLGLIVPFSTNENPRQSVLTKRKSLKVKIHLWLVSDGFAMKGAQVRGCLR